jgi:plasmid stabilization system protein ParE
VKYKVIILPGAEADFMQIHGYLKERFGKKPAARFKASFIRIIKELRHTPRMFQAVPERVGVHKCTALSPTIVLYEVFQDEKRVEILSLYDGRYPNG